MLHIAQLQHELERSSATHLTAACLHTAAAGR